MRRSLGTTARALAERKLANLQRSLSRTTAGGEKLTLAALCDRYLETTRSQAPATVYRKEAIARRVKADWPGGANVAISKVVTSQIAAWLASYTFGVASYTLYLMFVRDAFALAVADRLIAELPATLKIKKAKKPIRQTSTLEEIPAVVADIRARPFNAEARDSGDFVELPAYSHQSFRWQGHRDGGKLVLDTYSHVAPKHSARMALLMSEEAKQ